MHTHTHTCTRTHPRVLAHTRTHPTQTPTQRFAAVLALAASWRKLSKEEQNLTGTVIDSGDGESAAALKFHRLAAIARLAHPVARACNAAPQV